MPLRLDITALTEMALRHLRLEGPSSAKELRRILEISQASFSRIISQAENPIVSIGKGRATLYAAPRTIRGVSAPIPLYEIRPQGEPAHQIQWLHPIFPSGFIVESLPDHDEQGASIPVEIYDDLPWYLHPLRPSGFLGRLIPPQHPEQNFPEHIHLWSTDDTLRYATHFGSNLPGAFILGEDAYAFYIQNTAEASEKVPIGNREDIYAERANAAMTQGTPGSSAAGEQPKFLATVVDGNKEVPVLVKFSPPLDSPVNKRVADLLISESLALDTLRQHGMDSVRTKILHAANRVFLEVERFDRDGPLHRRGQIALEAIDAEYAGALHTSWSSSAAQLTKIKIITSEDHKKIQWLEYFGQLIANSDMHFGNLTFYLDGTTLKGLAPTYDMLPMLYHPQQGELIPRDFSPPIPTPTQAAFADAVIKAAIAFWQAVAKDKRITPKFRAIAKENKEKMRELEKLARLLPGQAH